MKVLQINNCHYRRGGADVAYLNTGELLEKHGQEVIYFALDNIKNEKTKFSNYFPKEINYRALSLFNKLKAIQSFVNNKETGKRLSKLIEIYQPEIAHVHLYWGGLTSSILKKLKEKNVPVVLTVHDYRLICPAYTFLDKNNNICEECRDGFYIRCFFKRCSLEGRFSHSAVLTIDAYYRKYIKNPIKLIDHFIFVSQFSRNKHEQFINCFKLKSSVLYNFRPGMFTQNNVRGEYFLFFGRLSREKGIELLIKTVKSLQLKLKIIGTGPLLREISAYNDANIEILGYKSGDELLNLIQKCSFVVVPSEWYENNPLTIIESFSFGKPVIGSNIGGIPELIQNSRGYLFEPKDEESMSTVFKSAMSLSEEEYIKMSDNAFLFAQRNFNQETHYESLIKIYKTVMHDKNSCQ